MKRTLGTCYYPEHWPRATWEEDARRMAEAGLVCRESSPEDRRVSYVVMTQPGRDALDRASPGHMRGIAQHFVRYLAAGDVALLQGFFSRVLDGESGG